METSQIGFLQNMNSLPGPFKVPLVGHLPLLLKHHEKPWLMMEEVEKKYGGMALLWVGPLPAVVLHDPVLIEEVLISRKSDFYKMEPVEALQPIGGDSSVFTANGEDWKEKKKRSVFEHSHFHSWLFERTPVIVDIFKKGFEKLAQKRKHSHFEEGIQKILFDALSHLIVGQYFDDKAYQDFMFVMKVGDVRMKTNLPLLPPHFYQVRNRWLERFSRILDTPSEGFSLAHVMRRSSTLTEEHFRNELANIYPGGLFSMTSALCNTLLCANSQSKSWQKLHAENKSIWKEHQTPEYETIQKNHFLEQYIREATRLFPPAPVFARAVYAQETQLGGYLLPEKTRILISQFPLQRNPTVWKDANNFQPERWTQNVMEKHSWGSPYFFPFGRGERTCIGQQLALFLVRIGVSTFVEHFHLQSKSTLPDQKYFFACMIPNKAKVEVKKL